jgi:predicted MFS family arabinose efflux permease
MPRRALRYYVDSFRGFDRAIWLLALVTFINRAGTMVIPFLSLYLTKDRGLFLEEVGWVMSCFGAGSVVGAWLGGRLADRIGYYDVMVGSLLSSGLAFLGLQYVQGFWPFCAAIFVLMVLADSFRPAMFVAIRSYAAPEQRTRAITLIRLAINLGFSMGPALGGAIIVGWGYSGLFWVDGLTCLAAMLLLALALTRAHAHAAVVSNAAGAQGSPYSDRTYLLFVLAMVLISIPFLQYFSTVPLFYSDVHHLSEEYIGLLLGANGLFIFLVEMPLVKYCEDRRFNLFSILRFSIVLFVLSFVVLNVVPTVPFLWVGMLFMTVGEMLNFPFMNRFAYDRSERGSPGAYMALFTGSWSVAHIIGHTLGLNLVEWAGYTGTWYFFSAVLLVGILVISLVERRLSRERVG